MGRHCPRGQVLLPSLLPFYSPPTLIPSPSLVPSRSTVSSPSLLPISSLPLLPFPSYLCLVLLSTYSQHTLCSAGNESALSVPVERFVSKKLTNKIMQQLSDCLVLTSMSLPDWCERLTKWCPMLFSHDMRSLYFSYTAFGTSRYITLIDSSSCLSVSLSPCNLMFGDKFQGDNNPTEPARSDARTL